MIQISDHVAQSIALIAQQYRGTRLEPLLTAFVNRCQELENALFPLLTLRSIDDSFGAQLDAIGLLVGQPRLGLVDVDYRQRLRAKVYLNRMSGTGPELVHLFELLANQEATEVEAYPAGFKLILDARVPDGSLLADLLQEAKAAGVKAILDFQSVDNAALFVWDSESFGLGWDENGDGTGGTWGEALE